MYIAFGENRTDEEWEYTVKVWDTLTRIILNDDEDLAISLWKKAILHIRCERFGRAEGIPPYPPEMPSIPPNSILAKPIMEYKDYQLLGTFMNSRSLPPANGQKIERARVQTRLRYTREVLPLSVLEIKAIRRGSFQCGRELRACVDAQNGLGHMQSHVSLSNSSCTESARSRGGKKAYVKRTFIEGWLQDKSPGEVFKTPFGFDIVFPEGEARWKANIPETSTPCGDIFGQEDHSTFIPSHAGFEERRISILLWVWATMSLQADGYISDVFQPTDKIFQATFTTLSECGWKTRDVTVTKCCLIVYLQPYAHAMRGLLECDPTLKAGLSAAHQAFEYAKRFLKQEPIGSHILLGDFENATDYIEFEAGRLHFDSMWDGFTKEGETISPYFRWAHLFFLRPLHIVEDDDYLTTAGAPMGIPGTKIALHTMGKAIDCLCHGEERTFSELKEHRFSCAGDDIIKEDSKGKLLMHEHKARIYRLRPSVDKWGVYERGGPFCEVIVLNHGLRDYPDSSDRTFFVVDSARGRLMSPEYKSGHGDEDKNPTWGKLNQLDREISWMKEPFKGFRNMVAGICKHSFRDFGKLDKLFGIPSNLGGLGLYEAPPQIIERNAPPSLLKALGFLARRWADPDFDDQTFRSIVTSVQRPLVLNRGQVVKLPEINPLWEMISEYCGMAEEDLFASHNCAPTLRLRDKRKVLQKAGLIDLTEIMRTDPFAPPAWLAKEGFHRGWATAPLEQRLRVLDIFKDEPLPSIEEIELALSIAKSQNYGYRKPHVWVYEDIAFLDVDEHRLKGLLSASKKTDSTSFQLPNRKVLFENPR